MKIYTIQLGRYRLANARGMPVIDITVKSGNKVFAPSWDMVSQYKTGNMSIATYEKLYKEMMRMSYQNHKEEWLSLLNNKEIALGCYCPAGEFCHRLLLPLMLSRVALVNNIPCYLMGEITK